MSLNTEQVKNIRKEFLALERQVHGKPLAYFDNAATTLKPKSMVQAISQHYQTESANIHRGVHLLSEQATQAYEETRKVIQNFIGAAKVEEVIFTKGTTEAINLVASILGQGLLKPGDEVVITQMEHHSNIVPWQLLRDHLGITLKYIPLTSSGDLDLSQVDEIITNKTKVVSFAHVSNSLGTINPAKELIAKAHAVGALAVVDGAQAVAHLSVNVQELDADFYAFSAHKLYGPTGVGVLYGKYDLLDRLPPYQGGGDMIESVTLEKSTYAPLPSKYEAGTPPIAGVIAFKQAIEFLQGIGLDNIAQYEDELLKYATQKLQAIEGIKIIGTADKKAAVVSFILKGVHPHDIGTMLDQDGLAVRTGHHCTQPVMQFFKVPATSRASFCFYNTQEEVDRLCAGLEKIKEFFA